MTRRARRHRVEHPVGASPGTLAQPPRASSAAIPPYTIEVISWSATDIAEARVTTVAAIKEVRRGLPHVWVNIDGRPDASVLAALGTAFGLHPLALEDVLHPTMRAKVEPYEQTLFVVAPMPLPAPGDALGAREFATEQLAVFLGSDFVVSVQERPDGDCLDLVRARLRSPSSRLRTRGPSHLAFAIFDAVIDHYFPLVNALSDRVDAVESKIIDQREAPDIYAIRDIRHDLARVRQALWPMRDAFTAMMSMEQWFDPDERLLLRNALDHVMRLLDMLESDRSCAGDLMELSIALANAKLGEVTKVLTMIATIFIPITFIASIEGMNFDFMPELKASWGYPAVLGLMAVTAAGFLVMFWRRGWFAPAMRPPRRRRASPRFSDD